MKIVLLVFALVCAAKGRAQSDIYFLPCEAKATVSFEGITQEGKDIHRLEVRRLAYVADPARGAYHSAYSCIIYYSGAMYGPEILKVIFDVMDPLVLLSGKDTVEIYYLSGAHTHWHQRWKLIGSTAKLEKEEVISWEDDPRMKNWLKPLKPTPPSQRGYLER